MRYQVLATDYDGTIAHDGRVGAAVLAALERVPRSGRKLVMVTGRELDDLLMTFPHCDLFDRIVAENGALLYEPRTKRSQLLAPPPPPALLSALAAAKVPISIGGSIVATVKPYEHALLNAIRDLGLEWHVIFNKDSVMALPSSVTKATGLCLALQELGIPPESRSGSATPKTITRFSAFAASPSQLVTRYRRSRRRPIL